LYEIANFEVELAFQNPFLMRAVFAISALHLAHLQPTRRKELVLSASNHQHLGLERFRLALQEAITEENCHAIFACSILLAACSMGSMGSLQSPGELTTARPQNNEIIPEWMNLLRGVYT
jgi:hypothetical protein